MKAFRGFTSPETSAGQTHLDAIRPSSSHPATHRKENPKLRLSRRTLAAKGFIALSCDPIGQGEREQTYLPQLGRALAGGGGNEHLELGARRILVGQSVARYFIFDARRAVDYLVSRPDADSDRSGVTACSGGDAIATCVGVSESRVKAAAVGCFINSFRTLFTGPTADSEMSFPPFWQATSTWMIRWLAGGKGDSRDQTVMPFTNLELQVTRAALSTASRAAGNCGRS